jgi:FdrA protein
VSGPCVVNRVRRAFYLDSVALMRLSRELSGRPGVEEAALMIGTSSNKEILDEAGLLADDGQQAASGDIIIALRAADFEAGKAALDEAEALLARSAAAERR